MPLPERMPALDEHVFFSALPQDARAHYHARVSELTIVPGVAALWPYLAARLVLGASAPPEEWNAHRRSARRPAPDVEVRS